MAHPAKQGLICFLFVKNIKIINVTGAKTLFLAATIFQGISSYHKIDLNDTNILTYNKQNISNNYSNIILTYY